MMKLVLALSVTAAVALASLAWNAQAASVSGSASLLPHAHNYSAVEQTGCVFGGRHCRAGFKWVCGPYAAPMGQRWVPLRALLAPSAERFHSRRRSRLHAVACARSARL